MCGRYVMAKTTGDLAAQFDLDPVSGETILRETYNVAPTSDVPIILRRPASADAPEGPRELFVARWGLVPVWAKDLSVGVRAFNARSETVLEKPTFRSAVKRRRCLVPVSGYYEWLAGETPKSAKRPFFIHPSDGSAIAFAGLYEWWKDPAPEDEWVLSCTILTMDSPGVGSPGVLGELGDLHDRLPIALSPSSWDAWLSPENDDAAGLVAMARAGAYEVASGWELREVSPAVGSVRNNGPELIVPLSEQTLI
jgi:putative SOS response-associated peptidase YedK